MADRNYALVIEGEVMNVWRGVHGTREDVSPVNAPNMYACPAETQPGWRYDAQADAFKPPIVPPPSVRKQRRTEYFFVLRKEDGDDELVVLGDVVDVALTQLEVIRQTVKSPATPEWAEMLGKILAVKAKLPKPPKE